MIKKLSRDEFVLMSADSTVKVVDVLPEASYRKEHIQGALSLPLEQLESKAASLLNKDDRIIVYCAGLKCTASTKAAEMLQRLGFTHVFDYKGGLEDYKQAGLPLEGEQRRFSCCSCGC